MRLFGIADTHLPSARQKDMERFGWSGHPHCLQRAWDESVTSEDVVIVAGDISWATRPSEVLDDLRWLDERPGRKVLLRGNHDFWWGDSSAKLSRLFEPYRTIEAFLHNGAALVGRWVIAGSRLWTAPEAPPLPGGELGSEDANLPYVKRECRRLQRSIEDACRRQAASLAPMTRIVAVHYPPRYANGRPTAFSQIIESFAPEVCVYGHLHGDGIPAGFVGTAGGVRYVLASCDAANFAPVLLDA